MRNEYDFAGAKRGALAEGKGKSRITIYLDNAILDEFRARAERAGTGYQTLVNEALKTFLTVQQNDMVNEATLRRIIREELPKASRKKVTSPRSYKVRAV
jgi:BrnA antitoxin of type II toxin-antitoxin system